jgi:hypothetical protein
MLPSSDLFTVDSLPLSAKNDLQDSILLNVVMLSGIVLNVIIPSVLMLSVIKVIFIMWSYITSTIML